jgi:cysteine desulfurase
MIYLDNHATTPCDPQVVEAMLPFFSVRFANPASEIHQMGRDARQAVDRARAHVAQLIGAQAEEIVFTASATESNNVAILGLASAGKANCRNNVIASAIEHKSVLEPCRRLQAEGFKTSVIQVDEVGCVDPNQFRASLNERALVASIQAANNEIGTIQNIAPISELVHECGAVFHCDAAQAVGKIPVNVDALGVDLLSISAHKMYGPKGIAALYIRGGASRSALNPLLLGGDQEWGLRPGTLNVPLIVGFGEACRIAADVMSDESARIALMRNRLESNLLAVIPTLKRNGDLGNRLPNNSSLTFPGVDAESLIMSIPELALSTGSACNSGAQDPSYVLRAIGLSHEQAQSTLRIGLGRFTTDSDVDIASALLSKRGNAMGNMA